MLAGPAAAGYIAGLDGVSLSSTFEHQAIADLPLHGWTALEGSARIFDVDANNGCIIANSPFDPYMVQYTPAVPVPVQPQTRYTLRFDMGFVAGNVGGSAEYSFELGTLVGDAFTPLGEARAGSIMHAGNLFSGAVSGSDELVIETGASVSGDPLAVRWRLEGYDLSGGNSDFFGFDNVTLDAASMLADTEPPSLVSAGALQNQTIALVFDEPMDEASALALANYSFGGGVIISGASLHGGGKVVVLRAAGLGTGNFTGSFSDLKDVSGNAASGSIAGAVLPFASEDIGELMEPGQAFPVSAEAVQISAGGVDVWGAEDSLHFTYQQRSGDFDVAVKLESFGPGGLPADAKALLMVREDISPGSRHVSLTTYPRQANWTAYQRQESYGASSVLSGTWRVGWGAASQFPTWLRVRRAGEAISTYGSTDGEVWTQIGDAVVPEMPYPNEVLIGVGVSAMTEFLAEPFPAHVVFSHFGDYAVPGGTVTFQQHPASLSVLENRPATFTASVQVTGAPAENVIYQWLRDDVAVAGPNAPSYTIPRASLDDSGARFAVRASLPGGASVTSEAAVLTVTPDTAAPAVLGASSVGGGSVLVRFNEPIDPDSAADPGKYAFTPFIAVYEAQVQPDGVSMLLIVDGLSGSSFTLAINGVADFAGNAVNTTVTGEILDWLSEDIGAVSLMSAVSSPEPGVFEVKSAGADIWTAADSFHFLYEELSGDFDVRVQLVSITLAQFATRGGLMAREDLNPGSRNIFAGTYAIGGQNNWVATVRAETDGTTTLGPGASFPVRAADFAFPNAWFRMLRAGQTFTTYYSTDGEAWIQLGDQITPDPAYPDTICVGMATASINSAAATTARYASYGPLAAPSAAVELGITREGGNLLISWPSNAEGYTLYTTPDFVAGNWRPVSATPTLVGGRYQVTVPAADDDVFFRLQK